MAGMYGPITILLKLFIFLTVSIEKTWCCDGYQLKINNVENCEISDIIKIEGNFTATLEDNCDIVARGCAKLKSGKPIKRFLVRYSMNKPKFVRTTGIVDVCKATRTLASPIKCPIPPLKLCLNGELKVNIANYRSLLGLAKGNVRLKLNGELDRGSICLEISGSIEKDDGLMIY